MLSYMFRQKSRRPPFLSLYFDLALENRNEISCGGIPIELLLEFS